MFGPGAFRLFLATMVLVSHVSAGRFGIVAVMIFFVLSGYWVTRMYIEKYARTAAPVPIFYLSRFLRLWPAFAVAILIAIALRALRGEFVQLNQLSVLTMLGVASGARDPLEITWSLDIELQFYILLPILLLLARLATAPVARLLTLSGMTVAAWVLAYAAGIETAFQYLPAFAAGMAIWLHDIRVSRRAALWSAAAFLIIGALLLTNSYTAGTIYEVPMPRRAQRFVSLFWALSLVPFVAWNVRIAAGGFDRTLGDFSYSLYLTHFPVIKTVGWLMGGDNTATLAAVKAVAALGVAIAFFLLIDRPSERLRLRLLSGIERGVRPRVWPPQSTQPLRTETAIPTDQPTGRV
jgi:peptidoglycan/LPS O-acetylase OafA/YrhL